VLSPDSSTSSCRSQRIILATQVKALAQAVADPDDEDRNNAVRALPVLSAARNTGPLLIDPQPFITLLFSGKWTDRNKGSILPAASLNAAIRRF
jgi:hypothetical protein